jgi:phenylacetate-CoA ligase
MLIVRGVNVYPSAVQAVVNQFPQAFEGPMQIVLAAKGPRVEPPLRVRVETREGAGELEAARSAFERGCREQLNVRLEAELVPAGTIARTEAKTRLIVVES